MTAAFKRKEYLYIKWRKARGLNCLRYWEQHQEAQAALRRLHSADVMARHLEQIFSGDLLPSRPTPPTNCAQPFDVSSCPINIDSINAAIKQLPRQKAPGIDHITIEMLSPLTDTLTPVLLYLFRLCWQWSYTPLTWRVAQVIPIHKKGSVSDPGNFRPISLTSTFRKILEKCLYPTLEGESPDLDIAQGVFRSSRSTLDQALCLFETCSILRRKHKITPTLAFLDIKSAYNTVDREHTVASKTVRTKLRTIKNQRYIRTVLRPRLRNSSIAVNAVTTP
ncbi:hypothetical protein RO3G_08659 [Rhizopus delemar RA 99-880]|uniref:Reverse transcriptase domain-containing protein n=1 Tax=Rhizopus delemar (strain RA 99-880 / ATCC MYA-4621 / FGSC 9543 / NRRL 43880) TaxID=246409 RepID=I1C674_RHIO9|nr:hypothetical protein RO3G_08659 [Rhizopus delemar RA 99-880]|eukprot:EIE83954.1 hypothetical protein RO3G_08659 [Rhizopus delemar RA 99-880]